MFCKDFKKEKNIHICHFIVLGPEFLIFVLRGNRLKSGILGPTHFLFFLFLCLFLCQGIKADGMKSIYIGLAADGA